jgi:hypothetical protein
MYAFIFVPGTTYRVLSKKACEIKEILFNGLKLKNTASGGGCLFLDSGYRIPDTGYRIPDAGCKMQDARWWIWLERDVI